MVDAVITWVDGDDPIHAAKRAQYLPQEPASGRRAGANADTRFSDRGELFFCIYLARLNAPWIENIYLVTDAQRPKWLDDKTARALGVTLIDHRVIFRGYEKYLPTFSSMSIETVIHRIPGLSEDFLYLNDDVFIVNPTTKDDFFPEDGYVFRGKWRRNFGVFEKLVNGFIELAGKRNVDDEQGLVGRTSERSFLKEFSREYFALAHTPHPLSSVLIKEALEGTGLIEANIKYRFRNKNQFCMANVVVHKAISSGQAVEAKEDWVYISAGRFSEEQVIRSLQRCRTDERIKSLCVQSLDLASPDIAKLVVEFLEDQSRRSGKSRNSIPPTVPVAESYFVTDH